TITDSPGTRLREHVLLRGETRSAPLMRRRVREPARQLLSRRQRIEILIRARHKVSRVLSNRNMPTTTTRVPQKPFVPPVHATSENRAPRTRRRVKHPHIPLTRRGRRHSHTTRATGSVLNLRQHHPVKPREIVIRQRQVKQRSKRPPVRRDPTKRRH